MNKPRICLVTNWYPSVDNPYRGIFFKEQAIAVENNFDFLVFNYREKIKKKPVRTITIKENGKEANITEYKIDVYLPLRLFILDKIETFKRKYIKKNGEDGTGRYYSKARIKYLNKLWKKILTGLNEKFDALYCVDAQNEAMLLSIISQLTNKPYVVSEHAPFPWPGTVIADYQKKAIENADGILAISYDKIRQMQLQNVKLKNVSYIGNLVDETQFVIANRKDNSVKTLLIVAANSFYKNYDLFIEIMNRLTKITTTDFRIMIVGYASNKGYSKDTEILESKIRNSDFAEKVELIPEVPHSEIVSVYNNADVFVMTSIQEGQPVSALEAACCGLPVFSTGCGGVEDYVTEEIGRIYNMMDVESFANGLKDFVEGRITFDSEIIRNRIVSKFGKKAFVTNFTNVFNDVISNKTEG